MCKLTHNCRNILQKISTSESSRTCDHVTTCLLHHVCNFLLLSNVTLPETLLEMLLNQFYASFVSYYIIFVTHSVLMSSKSNYKAKSSPYFEN